MRILWVSEYRAFGGGYTVITEGMARALNAAGVEVKVLGLNYHGEEHDLPVSVIPLLDPTYLITQIDLIVHDWLPDAVVVALDLPHQRSILERLKSIPGSFRTVGVFPIEGEPLYLQWAEAINRMNAAFALSNFGVETCAERGCFVERLPIGVPHGILPARAGDITLMRRHIKMENRFGILKIADNHTRKNWAHTIEYFARWHGPDDTLFALTRPENAYGWDLEALAEDYGAVKIPGTTVMQWADGGEIRFLAALNQSDKAWLLNVCDMMLVDSGNEGLCLPILEAFAVGLPVAGMQHTAIAELLADGRGVLFAPGYEYRDTFGNVKRYYPQYEAWAAAIDEIKQMPHGKRAALLNKAGDWLKTQRWEDAVRILLDGIEGAL